MDDVNGGLIQLFRIHLIVKNGTEYLDKLSSVRQIRCLIPQGNVFAVIWNKKLLDSKEEHGVCNGEQEHLSDSTKSCPPALAIFSPFGEQWWCSLEDSASSYSERYNITYDNKSNYSKFQQFFIYSYGLGN